MYQHSAYGSYSPVLLLTQQSRPARMVDTQHECITVELLARLLARAAFMQHDDEWHSISKHYPIIKGLKMSF